MLPAIIDALFTKATDALPDALVTDGFGLSDDPNQDVLMIGVDDADAPGGASSVDSDQASTTAGTTRPRQETGFINCVAFSIDGGSDAKAARDAAYATFGAVETLLREDPRIGLTAPALLVAEIGGHQLQQDLFATGAGAWVAFTVKFTTRI